MKNVVVLRDDALHAALPAGAHVEAACVDSFTATAFMWLSSRDLLVFHTAEQTSDVHSVRGAGGEPPLVLEGAQCMGMQYIDETGALCMAFDTGEVVLFKNGELECVGVIDSGVFGMAWSPDCELVILATGNATLLCMTREWDILYEVPQHPDHPHPLPLEGERAARVRISWRADGKCFAANVVDPDDSSKRVVRVWDRACTYEASSEADAHLGRELSYRPAGPLMAASRKLPHTHDHQIVFYERNGLRHGEFSLRVGDDIDLTALVWSPTSDILAVVLRRGDISVLQLWTTGNYHWYLKQEMLLDVDDNRVCALEWAEDEANALFLFFPNGTVRHITVAMDHTVGSSAHRFNLTTAAVIDGKRVLLTPLALCVVPPPMAAAELVLESDVCEVAFAPDCTMAVYTCDNHITFFAAPFISPDTEARPRTADELKTPPRRLGRMRVPDGVRLHQILHTHPGEIVAMHGPHELALLSYRLPDNDDTGDDTVHCTRQRTVPLDERVYRIACDRDTGGVVVQLADKRVVIVNMANATAHPLMLLGGLSALPALCPWLTLTSMGGVEHVLIARSLRSKLFLHGRELAPDCVSYVLHDDFLLYVTLRPDYALRMVSVYCPLPLAFANVQRDSMALPEIITRGQGMTDQMAANIKDKKRGGVFDVSWRMVERGTNIVAAAVRGIRIVLQMPRGNLEVIYPRALTLSAVRKCLDTNRYGAAMALVRKHRIDPNFLYDHNPDAFSTNIGEALRQIDNPAHISFFLSALRDEDLTKTTFLPPEHHARSLLAAATGTPVGGGHRRSLYDSDSDADDDANSEDEAAPGNDDAGDGTGDGGEGSESPGETSPFSTRSSSNSSNNNKRRGGADSDGEADKVNKVCTLCRDELNAMDAGRYFMCVLTSYAAMQPPQLEEALRHINRIRQADGVPGAPSIDAALDALAVMVKNVNVLYDVALGMYDFELVLMVARRTQKDPKQYLPFLNELSALAPALCKYRIDTHLGRHESALRHLVGAGDEHFELCLNNMHQHGLFRLGVELYAEKPDHLRVVWENYGHYLDSRDEYSAAGDAYSACGQLGLAAEAYANAGLWQQALACSCSPLFDPLDLEDLCEQVVGDLVARSEAVLAAMVLRDYSHKGVDGAVRLLLRMGEWGEAERLARAYKLDKVINETLPAAVREQTAHLLRKYRAMHRRMDKYVQRLAVVRDTRERMAGLSSLQDRGGAGADDASVAGSTTSDFTMVTTSSFTSVQTAGGTRRRKKKRVKRFRLKEGSPYEEDALVQALEQLKVTDAMRVEVNAGLHGLLRMGDLKQARALHRVFGRLDDLFVATLPSLVYPVRSPDDAETARTTVAVRTAEQKRARFSWRIPCLHEEEAKQK